MTVESSSTAAGAADLLASSSTLSYDESMCIDWVDEFLVEGSTRQTGEPHRWRGAEFSTLVVLDKLQLGLFLGIDDPSILPVDFFLKTRFAFQLLDVDNNVLTTSTEDKHTFTYSSRPERSDFGNFNIFPHYKLPEGVEIDGVPLYNLRIRVAVEEMWTPRPSTGIAANMVGILNQGATCYLNSLLQMLFHLNKFRRSVYQLPHAQEELHSSTTLALQSLFYTLQTSSSYASTTELTRAFGWDSQEAFMQQDVQEMMRVLLDKLEEKMKGSSVDSTIKDLFCGASCSYIRCINVKCESKREEEFYDLQLDVKGCKDIHESLRKYIAIETLDGENQYHSDEFGKQDAQKGVIFTKFPPVLTIHLKRFDFDLETFGFKKIHDNFEFPLVLEMDKYLDAEAASPTPNRFLLHSVLVHNGDVGGGHYYAYIRPGNASNFDSVYSAKSNGSGTWFKFNDELVSESSEYEAVNNNFGQRMLSSSPFLNPIMSNTMHSAYMLVYIREEDAPDVMKVVDESDVPSSLLDRFVIESQWQQQLEREAAERLQLRQFKFATENNIRNFVSFSKSSSLLSDDQFQCLEIVDDCSLLGLVILLAAKLGVMPNEISLWTIDKQKIGASRWSLSRTITEDTDCSYYRRKANEVDRWYVQIIVDDQPHGFKKNWLSLENDYNVWEEDVRAAHQQAAGTDNLSVDPCAHCGLGRHNKALHDLASIDNERFEALRDRLRDLELLAIDMIKGEKLSSADDVKENVLLFVRVFDPQGVLTFLNSNTVIGNSLSIEDQQALQDELNNMTIGVTGDTEHTRFCAEWDTSTRAPFPYMRTMIVPSLSRVSEIRESLCQKVAKKIRQEFKRTPDFAATVASAYESGSLCYICNNPCSMRPMQDTNDSDDMNTIGNYLEVGGTIVLCPKSTVSSADSSLKPSGFDPSTGTTEVLATTSIWNEYDANDRFWELLTSRVFIVTPLDVRDLAVLYNVRASMLLTYHSNDSRDGIEQPSPTRCSESPPIDSLSNLNEEIKDADNEVDQSLNDGLQSTLRKRVASDLSMTVNESKEDVRILSAFAFQCSLSVAQSTFVHFVASKLQVDPAHVALVITPEWCDRDDEDVSPLHALAEGTLAEFLDKYGYHAKKTCPRLRVQYRLLPFPIYSVLPDSPSTSANILQVLDNRISHATMDFVLCGDHIRQYRRRSLSQLQRRVSTAFAGRSLQPVMIWEGSKSDVAFGIANLSKRARRSEDDCPVDSSDVDDESTPEDTDSDGVYWNPYEYFDSRTLSVLVPLHYYGDEIPVASTVLKSVRYQLGLPTDAEAASNSLLQQLSRSPGAVISDSQSLVFPLTMCTLHSNGMIHNIVSGDTPVNHLVNEFTESRLAVPLKESRRFSLQFCDIEQAKDMHHDSSKLKTTAMSSICSFTLRGHSASPCAPQLFSGPLVFAVQRDDFDIESLVERLVKVTGDESIRHCRVASISNNLIPEYFPRSSSLVRSNTAVSLNEADDRGPSPAPPSQTIWDIMKSKRPLFFGEEGTLVQEELDQALVLEDARRNCPKVYMPVIGIHRSATDMATPRSKKSASFSIKIV